MFKTAPCSGQTAESIETWLRANIAPGVSVVIRSTQGGILSYKLATVTGTGRGCLYLDRAGDSGGCKFHYSGKSSSQPKGQTRLVEPTAAVLAGCETLADFGLRYSEFTV